MATATVETGIVLRIPAEILGPGSLYEERRLALRKDWQKIVTAAQGIRVTDAESCEQATQAGRLLQASSKELELFYKPIKQQIDDLKKPVLAAEKEDLAAIDREKSRLGAEVTVYNREQQRIREEAERAAREAAEKAAREELLNRAVELEASGDAEQAAAVLEEPVMAPVVIQAVAAPRVAGQVSKATYKMRVVDMKKLLRAVLDGVIPIHAVTANESYLNNRARDDKEAFDIPGCELVKIESTHFRS